MSREYFIIMVYLLVCENYQAIVAKQRLRHGGFPPSLTDEEVITIEICGEYFGLSKDAAIFHYFQAHDHSFFPHLRERTGFVRQAANLWGFFVNYGEFFPANFFEWSTSRKFYFPAYSRIK